jgi:hypothetical protein
MSIRQLPCFLVKVLIRNTEDKLLSPNLYTLKQNDALFTFVSFQFT